MVERNKKTCDIGISEQVTDSGDVLPMLRNLEIDSVNLASLDSSPNHRANLINKTFLEPTQDFNLLQPMYLHQNNMRCLPEFCINLLKVYHY